MLAGVEPLLRSSRMRARTASVSSPRVDFGGGGDTRGAGAGAALRSGAGAGVASVAPTAPVVPESAPGALRLRIVAIS